jgi:hypothetical protein
MRTKRRLREELRVTRNRLVSEVLLAESLSQLLIDYRVEIAELLTSDPPVAEDHENLIRWLALTYGDNNPIWPLRDALGQRHEENYKMARTWYRVVRDGLMPPETSQEETTNTEDNDGKDN